MSEFLKDNLEAERRYAGSVGTSIQSQRRQRREVPDLLSWVQCFGTYISVVASRYPEKVRQLLAYQMLIIREARRLGGKGWLAYDTMFRQQAATSNTVDWSQLNSTLYAVTFLAQQGNRTRPCALCMESDHREDECSLGSDDHPVSVKRDGAGRLKEF